jgi:hypothetical protein
VAGEVEREIAVATPRKGLAGPEALKGSRTSGEVLPGERVADRSGGAKCQ